MKDKKEIKEGGGEKKINSFEGWGVTAKKAIHERGGVKTKEFN